MKRKIISKILRIVLVFLVMGAMLGGLANTVTANFAQVTYTLTMAVSGNGTTTPPAGQYSYPPGTSVNITATPASGWLFVNWGGTDNNTANPTIVTVNYDKRVTAYFVRQGGSIYLGSSIRFDSTDINHQGSFPSVYDWNGDGKKDLIVGHYQWGSAGLAVYLNEGEDSLPRFSVPTFVPLTPPSGISSANEYNHTVADWNNDGLKDVISAAIDNQYSYLVLHTNNGTVSSPSFNQGVLIQAAGTDIHLARAVVSPHVVDWNSDGKKDLLVGADRLYIYLNVGTNDSPLLTEPTEVLGVGWVAPFVIDWDNDGKKDLLTGDFWGYVHLFLNENTDPSPAFSRSTMLSAGNGDISLGVKATPYIVDWDNDGRKDLLVGNEEGFVFLHKNIGTDSVPRFAAAERLQSALHNLDSGRYTAPLGVDWNNDGAWDLLVGDYGGMVNLYLNKGTNISPLFGSGTHVSANNTSISHSSYYTIPYVIDWNNDGKKDLLVGNYWLYLYLNLGTDQAPVFNSETKLQANSQDIRVGDLQFSVVDWDNDSKKDLVVGEWETKGIFVYKNSGSDSEPFFADKVQLKANGVNVTGDNLSPIIVDWDRDGRNDLLTMDKYGVLKFYRNVGAQGEPVLDTGSIIGSSFGFLPKMAIMDWNQDGIWDLLVGEDHGYVELYYGSLGQIPQQPGDANGDGVVNALDITKVERIIAGLDASTPGADANQDGNVNALDITKVERLIAGLG